MSSTISLPELSLKQLDHRLQVQFEKAAIALQEGNTSYAIELGSIWVEKYPHVPEFRMLLREAQLQVGYPDKQYQTAPASWKAGLRGLFFQGEKDPVKAMLWCEQRLSQDPLDMRANESLANAANSLKWKNTEVFALQILLLHPRRTVEQVIRLVKTLIGDNQMNHASEVCDTFLKVFPEHRELLALRKQVSITQSIQQVDS